MVKRIVKLTFKPELVSEFEAIFKKYQDSIRCAEGCTHLELWQSNQHIFFTYSWWEDEKYLEDYRQSELFAEVWPQTKKLFAQPAEAWTVQVLAELP
jgi:quinol monooxygenase YgiN